MIILLSFCTLTFILLIPVLIYLAVKKIQCARTTKPVIQRNEFLDTEDLWDTAEEIYEKYLEEKTTSSDNDFTFSFENGKVTASEEKISFFAVLEDVFLVNEAAELDTDACKINSDNLVYKLLGAPKTEISCENDSLTMDFITNDYDACWIDEGDEILFHGIVHVTYDGENMEVEQAKTDMTDELIDVQSQKRLYKIFSPEKAEENELSEVSDTENLKSFA